MFPLYMHEFLSETQLEKHAKKRQEILDAAQTALRNGDIKLSDALEVFKAPNKKTLKKILKR